MYRIAPVLLFLALTISTGLAHELPAADRAESAASVAPEPLDLNRATVEELDELPGIGPALAARIVAFRDEHGPFTRIDQLNEVKGIGVKTLEKLRPFLVLQ